MKELGAINGKDVNTSGFGDVLCKAPCVLRANVLMSITEEVRDVFSCGSEREVGISGAPAIPKNLSSKIARWVDITL